jgi:protein ImuB
VFACLSGDSPRLAELAGEFSPLVENKGADTVVFSIAGLGSLIGDAHQIAAAIARQGAAMGLAANLAIAPNPSAAILAARNLPGTTILVAGNEAHALASIPIEALPAAPDQILTLRRWGIHTLGELSALPEAGLVERLGAAGSRLRRLALGQGDSILDIQPPAIDYTAHQELDHPIELLEPLLFVLSSMLHELTRKLQHNGGAASRMTVTLTLDRYKAWERRKTFTKDIDLPVAVCDPVALLKQIQLALEAHPPRAASVAVGVTLHPAPPRVAQSGLFMPAAPEPEKLQTLLARLRALAGEDHVGSPELLNTHRPDAWQIRPCAFEPCEPKDAAPRILHLALRYFRPPVSARVDIDRGVLKRVVSSRISGKVVQCAGPWRTSGEWWTDTVWSRDEWDVVLEDRAIYRLYLASEQWFIDGSYD